MTKLLVLTFLLIIMKPFNYFSWNIMRYTLFSYLQRSILGNRDGNMHRNFMIKKRFSCFPGWWYPNEDWGQEERRSACWVGKNNLRKTSRKIKRIAKSQSLQFFAKLTSVSSGALYDSKQLKTNIVASKKNLFRYRFLLKYGLKKYKKRE